jgi:hypothetical protein
MATTFDLATPEGRAGFDAYLADNPGAGPEPPFAQLLVEGRTGPPRRIQAERVDLLVPKSLADEVALLRDERRIPQTRQDTLLGRRVIARFLR